MLVQVRWLYEFTQAAPAGRVLTAPWPWRSRFQKLIESLRISRGSLSLSQKLTKVFHQWAELLFCFSCIIVVTCTIRLNFSDCRFSTQMFRYEGRDTKEQDYALVCVVCNVRRGTAIVLDNWCEIQWYENMIQVEPSRHLLITAIDWQCLLPRSLKRSTSEAYKSTCSR